MRETRRTPYAVLIGALLLADPASAGTIFVDDDATGANTGASFADAYPTLTQALTAAQPGDRIFVAAGVYRPHPTDPWQSFWLKKNVKVYGGFDGTETALADRAGLFDQTVLTKGGHIVRAQNVGPAATLDGFRIEGGVGASDDYTMSIAGEGGGMLLEGCTFTVRNCSFVGNEARGTTSPSGWGGPGLGGAVAIRGGTLRFVRCRFEANVALGESTYTKPTPAGWALGGAVDVEDADAAFHHCAFFGNRAIGGESSGIDLEWGFGDAGGDARGGAISCSGGRLTVDQCVFSQNTSRGGDGFGWPGTGRGGAVHADDAVITSTTIFGNLADQAGGVEVGVLATPAVLANSVLWANRETGNLGFDAQVDGVFTLAYCDVAGYVPGLGGVGNIAADPQVVDPDGPDGVAGTADDDLRLLPASPCIDAGDNARVAPDLADIDDDLDVAEAVPLDQALLPRFQDRVATPDTGVGAAPIVDLGAYEHQVVCQEDLGGAGPGGPQLEVCGDDLTLAGSSAVLEVIGAAPGASVYLVVGLSQASIPFLGGVLEPAPLLLLGPLTAGAAGSVSLSVPGAGGAAVDVYLQAIAVDAGGPALSNALRVRVGT